MKVALIGCGAVTQLYYASALCALSACENLKVVALVDPSRERAESLNHFFPEAAVFTEINTLTSREVDLAIVASPPRFHAPQSIALLTAGIHVLCEKPMAITVNEAEAMIDAARRSERKLSVGLFRRFLPTSETIRDIIQGRRMGELVSIRWSEGGLFNWPAASPSFFQRSGSSGGVLADLGVHCLDLLLWWCGEPVDFEYEDDCLGGLEANCRVNIRFSGGRTAALRLSRDTEIPNYLQFEFERGWLRLEGVSATELVCGWHGAPYAQKVTLQTQQVNGLDVPGGLLPQVETVFTPARSYQQSFMRQIQDLCAAIREQAPLRVSGEEGLRSLRLIQACYSGRKTMEMEWMPELRNSGVTENLMSPTSK